MCATCSSSNQRNAHDEALDTLEALGEAGLAVVPSTPTADMVAAGARVARIDPDTATRIYLSMLAAAP